MKRASGGARAVAKKRAIQEAARRRAEVSTLSALRKAPTNPEAGHEWLALVMLATVEEAINDPGLPPEQRRAEIGRLVSAAAKIMDPAKLSAKLALYEAAIEELHGAPVDRAQNGDARSDTAIQ